MLDKKTFPRDADGNVLHKQPCQTKGCNYPNYHVCLVGTEDRFKEALLHRPAYGGRAKGFVMRNDHREAISESVRARFAAMHAKNAPRDRQIMELYNQRWSQASLARKFGISPGTVKGVISRSKQSA